MCGLWPMVVSLPLERSLSLAITALWSFLFPGTDTPSIRNSPSIAEKESAAEILLEAKGFQDVVVSINGDAVDVVVNAPPFS